jgi:hypothetical protein
MILINKITKQKSIYIEGETNYNEEIWELVEGELDIDDLEIINIEIDNLEDE